mgnify:CR=1 FL=1
MAMRKGLRRPNIIRADGSMVFYFSLTLHPARDKEIIEEILSTPLGHVSAKMREMMRNGTISNRFQMDDSKTECAQIRMGEMDVEL